MGYRVAASVALAVTTASRSLAHTRGLCARIVTRFHFTPPDFSRDLNADLGFAFSLEPLLPSSAWLRTHNRQDRITIFTLSARARTPGAGIPGLVGSAKATTALMLEDMK